MATMPVSNFRPKVARPSHKIRLDHSHLHLVEKDERSAL
jgi:hypothetical protein